VTRATISIVLAVRGPVITKASSIGGFGVDALMAKGKFVHKATGAVEDRYCLPGRLIKGLLREAWQELSTVDPLYAGYISRWLGSESITREEPLRGSMIFGDFVDPNTDTKALRSPRYRIQIDEARGAADGQMLQVMESPYAPGQRVEFEGEVRCILSDEADIGTLHNALRRGLLWIRAVGGTRTSGFGQVLDVILKDSHSPFGAAKAELQVPRWQVRFSFREPLILSKRRIADNFFESDESISGGALRGAIAEMMKREPGTFVDLQNELHLVRCTHAFPAEREKPRPAHWPLSLLNFGKDEIVDAIRHQQPYARKDEAGRFDIDWKDDVAKTVRTAFGWPQLPKDLRVRTAIDSTRRRAADEKLFAWQMIVPHHMEWIATIETSALSAAARTQLEQLFRFGIEPLGKTKALADAVISPAPPVELRRAPAYAVTLQTPTLLINPDRNLAPRGHIGARTESVLQREFELVWDELSNGSLVLMNYFQRSHLAGGEYFWRRFSQARGTYKPYLLSSPGSTFLLKPSPGKEEEALALAVSWITNGLPLSDGVRTFYGVPEDAKVQWEHCPYIPQNGYGEVTVNHQGPYPEA